VSAPVSLAEVMAGGSDDDWQKEQDAHHQERRDGEDLNQSHDGQSFMPAALPLA
jgi:hypothetical protein